METRNGHHLSLKPYGGKNKSPRYRKNLFPRRVFAWLLEISLLTGSATIPYTLGIIVNSNELSQKVPLNPILAQTEDSIASILALEKRSPLEQKISPLTNLLWWVALITPTGWTAWQMFLLGKTGQTTPKKWLGIRVVRGDGQVPGLKGVVLREIVGRWGLPLGVAYGIWYLGGGFPSLPILTGLGGLMLLAEGGMIFLGEKKRTFHDLISNTFIIDSKQPLINNNYIYQQQTINFPVNGDNNNNNYSESSLQTIVLTTKVEKGNNLWQWMKSHPGTTLIIFSTTGMLSILITFIGTQVYIQSQANFRNNTQQNNKIFLTLVQELTTKKYTSFEQKRSAILALARLEDQRAGQMLVDLLGQENDPALLETIQQAIVSNGVDSLPALRRLNQSLSNDIKSLANSTMEAEMIALRLRATKRAIAKLLTIHQGNLGQSSLHRTNLGQVTMGNAQFSLVLEQVDLGGVNFRGALLNGASLRGSSFYDLGLDHRFGTFDDLSADLSGANLQEADLTGAFLPKINLNLTNLVRSNLNKANLSGANLTNANLSSALIVNSNLEKSNLEKASLTGANISESNLNSVNLKQANLSKIKALGTNLSGANLTGSTIENGNFYAANLDNTNLQNAIITNSNLQESNLQNSKLQNAKLSYSNLSNADLRGANIAGADFQGVIFALKDTNNNNQFIQAPPLKETITKMEAVDFSQVKNLDNSQLEIICQAGGIHPRCN